MKTILYIGIGLVVLLALMQLGSGGTLPYVAILVVGIVAFLIFKG